MYGVIDKMADRSLEKYDALVLTHKNELKLFDTYREALQLALDMQCDGECSLHYVVIPLPGIKGK